MRPLRLLIDGFGSYRDTTELDLSDVDFFVLTGPTGSGKSTVIDSICFALYGTVPRWGKGNVIRNALAPSTAECRVCLVFEAAGGRYVAARQLRRDARGQVHTKEARLDRLDPAVPVDAELTRVLEAVAESVAEGPENVTAGVTELLGIGYEHFTQCVLLPQGRFAEFLQAKPADRQDLLIELLAYAVYEQVGQKARERGKLAASRLAAAQARLAKTPEVTDEDVAAARHRVTALAGLVTPVDEAIERMLSLREQWTEANAHAKQAREQLTALAELTVPAGVPELAARLADADTQVTRRDGERTTAETAETDAERECAGLTELPVLARWRDGQERATALRSQVAARRTTALEAAADEGRSAAAVTAAERALTEAETRATEIDRDHRAAALAVDLRAGEPCPVCRQVVATVPHHELAGDVDAARATVTRARTELAAVRKRHGDAVKRAAVAANDVESALEQLTTATEQLADAPEPADLADAITRREAADAALTKARSAARAARTALDQAAEQRAALGQAEQRAWTELRASRDRFVALQAPPVDAGDLAIAWRRLVDWAAEQRDVLTARAAELDQAEAALRDQGQAEAAGLVRRLREFGIDVAAQPDRAPVVLAGHRAQADRDGTDLVARQAAYTELAAEIDRCREESEVADLLGQLLRSNKFEAWLCAEALDSLVAEASQTLLQLSGNQYELFRGDRNDLVVVDHNDAGTHRPVNTLSGGETFQASLALALALSRQVVGLSGGRRDLNSMFLDEGFGTLDETTLDTVAVTLERLAQETDRMVGIVTHVPALAERVPVQFAVRRQGASSTIHRVDV